MGDTRGGKWGCHPSIFSWNTWRPFFGHRCHYHYRFLLLSLRSHPPQGCHTTPFLPVRPCFSTILCKFAHKIFFPLDVTPLEGVTRGGLPPPSDATAFAGKQSVPFYYCWYSDLVAVMLQKVYIWVDSHMLTLCRQLSHEKCMSVVWIVDFVWCFQKFRLWVNLIQSIWKW